MRAKSSGKNNYNRSPSKRSRTSPIPISSFLSLSLFTSPCSLSHSYPGTTSHIRGSTILYKILAVVILGALYYYFFITMRHTTFKGSNLYAPCAARSTNNNTNDILLSILSHSLYAPFSNHVCICTYIQFRSNRHARDVRIIG